MSFRSLSITVALSLLLLLLSSPSSSSFLLLLLLLLLLVSWVMRLAAGSRKRCFGWQMIDCSDALVCHTPGEDARHRHTHGRPTTHEALNDTHVRHTIHRKDAHSPRDEMNAYYEWWKDVTSHTRRYTKVHTQANANTHANTQRMEGRRQALDLLKKQSRRRGKSNKLIPSGCVGGRREKHHGSNFLNILAAIWEKVERGSEGREEGKWEKRER